MPSGSFQHCPVPPCRVADTRNPTGTNGGPALSANNTRNFRIQSNCGVPVGAAAVTLNVTVVRPASSGSLTLWPSGGAQPSIPTMNFAADEAPFTNEVIIPLSSNVDDLSGVFAGSGTMDIILDVTGYFAP